MNMEGPPFVPGREVPLGIQSLAVVVDPGHQGRALLVRHRELRNGDFAGYALSLDPQGDDDERVAEFTLEFEGPEFVDEERAVPLDGHLDPDLGEIVILLGGPGGTGQDGCGHERGGGERTRQGPR